MSVSPRRYSTLDEWLSWLETLHPKKIDLSLDRVTEVLKRLGLADPPYRVITVAGTNGKGSCVAMLESIYWHAGHHVGSFTSPHVWRFNERVRFDGADATDEQLIELFEIIDGARGTITLSYFESSAVAALLHFARCRADVAVLEVGMGGRLDAVNAIDTNCALIVSVDLDHQEWLGPDRESIGYEKAGIMRPHTPAIVAERTPAASVLAHAAAIGARVRVLGRDFDFEPVGAHWRPIGESAIRGQTRNGSDPGFGRPADDCELLPRPEFGGDEQYGHAAACVQVVEQLQSCLPVSRAALSAGLRAAHLHGRLERHTIDGAEWVFDVAHNPAAAANLRSSLGRLPAARCTLAVFAAMHDKDLAGVLAPFADLVERWFVTRASADRGAAPETLTAVLTRAGARDVTAAADVAAACEAARRAAQPGDRVLVFGSFHTVGAATAALRLYSAPSPFGNRPAKWTRV